MNAIVAPGLNGFVFGHRRRDGIHVLENLARLFGILNLKAKMLIQRDHQLEGVHGIQSKAIRPEERLAVTDFLRTDLEHKVFYDQSLDVSFELCRRVHCKQGSFSVGVC